MSSHAQPERYRRQRALPGFGPEGQARLRKSSVLVIGLGGLGAPAVLYLAGAGIGTLGMADDGVVEESNLHRQILYRSGDLGRRKTEAAAEACGRLNPEVSLAPHPARLGEPELREILPAYDFVVDATDTFASKYAVSDACVRAGKPYCHGALSGWRGQLFTFVPGGRAGCYRCLFPPPPPEEPENQAVFGPTAGMVAALQAQEALKYCLAAGDLLVNRLLTLDAWSGTFRTISFRPAVTCRCRP